MSSRLESLAEGLRHVYVEMPASPRKKYFIVRVTTEPTRLPGQAAVEAAWFAASLKGGRVYIRFLDPLRRVVLAPVYLGDFRSILLDAEKSIQVGNTAAAIVLERAAEILAQRFRPDQIVATNSDNYSARFRFVQYYESGQYSLNSRVKNNLRLEREWVVHKRAVDIELYGRDLSEEEVELVRMLAEDLADIFKAPDLRKLGQLTLTLSDVESKAEIWREETRYRSAEADESP